MAIIYSISTDPEALGRDANNADVKLLDPTVVALSVNAPITAGLKKITLKAVDTISGDEGFNFVEFTVITSCGVPDAFPTTFMKLESANAAGAALFPFLFNGCTYDDGETKHNFSSSFSSVNGQNWNKNDTGHGVIVQDNVAPAVQIMAATLINVSVGVARIFRGNGPGYPGDIDEGVISDTFGTMNNDGVVGPDNMGSAVLDVNGLGAHIKFTISEGPQQF